MRRLVIGDIHGEYNRMIDVLEKCGFDPKQDELYFTGDFCDRGPKPVEVLDYLYSLPRFFPVVGNHDLWLLRYLQKRITHDDYRLWIDCNYGNVTQRAVYAQSDEWKRAVIDRIESTPFVRRIDDTLIVHGGIGDYVREQMDSERFVNVPCRDLDHNAYLILYEDVIWDRNMLYKALRLKTAERIFGCRVIVGHTPLKAPFISDDGNLIAIDTASFVPSGCITVMDIDTGEFWHSTSPAETTIFGTF